MKMKNAKRVLKILWMWTVVASIAMAATSCALAEKLGTVMAENAETLAKTTFSAKGTIAKPDTLTLIAPMGGQAGDFTWATGDAVKADELAFAITPTQLYAANDGVVVGLQAKVGDLATAVQAQYGALCYIDREDIWHVNASTVSAYDDPVNRDVNIGDVLRVRNGTGSNAIRGMGTVISRTGRNFVVEMPKEKFEIEKSVNLYFGEGDNYKEKEQVGKGTVVRPAMLPVNGEGVVAQVLVKNGDKVKRGQPLFTLDSPSATYGDKPAKPEVRFPEAGLVNEVLVRPGQFLAQNQAVATLLPVGALEAALEVDELDIAKVQVGQAVRVTVDAYSGQERTGTVREIRAMGLTVLDTTKFLVKVAFDKADDLMIGMHVTGYWD